MTARTLVLAPFLASASALVPSLALAAPDASATAVESEPAAEAEAEPAVEAQVEPAAEAKAEPAAELEVEPAAEAKVEPAAEAKAEPAAEVEAEPAAEAKVETAAEAKAEPAAEVEVEPAAEVSPAPDPDELRRSGAHLRPKREAGLLTDHEVHLGRARFSPGDGLVIESANGRFALATRLRAQFRYTLDADTSTNKNSHSLQIRRARIVFGGHFWNRHNRFKTELALSPMDMAFADGVPHRTPILDWYLEFDYLRDLTVRVGQYKIPYNRQRVISSGDLQLVDRSIANAEFTLDRDLGIDLRSYDFLGLGHLRYYAGVYMGEGRDQFEPSNLELMYLARVEVLPFGLFEDYAEVDFERSLRPRVSMGLAYAFVDGAVRDQGSLGAVPTDGGTTDYSNVNGDIMFKMAGFSLFTDVFWRKGKRNFGDATIEDEDGELVPAERQASRDGIGWSAQAGYLVPRTSFEISARYGQTRPASDGSGVSDRDEVGGALSYYFAGHSMKLQADYFAQVEDAHWRRPNHVLRVQLQAAF